MKTVLVVLLFSAGLMGQKQSTVDDVRQMPYSTRAVARMFGNIGGWWSFMSQDEKEAFLDGYKVAMRRGQDYSGNMCTVNMTMVKNSNEPWPAAALVTASGACELKKDFADYDKVTIQDLDGFYGDPTNQPILLQWAMEYLRDKAAGTKTEGQLLDRLKQEQADIHDCAKYPNLCKLGAAPSPK